jgi:hypothetical protein
MPRERTRTLIWLGSAILALVLLASGLAGVTFRPGHLYDFGALPLPSGAPAQALAAAPRPPDWLSVVVTLIVLALLLGMVIHLILSREFRRELLIRMISMLIVVTLFYLLVRALRGSPSEGYRVPTETAVPPPPSSGGEPFPTFVANPAPWLIIVVSAILAALLLGALWFVWRRRHPQPGPLERLAGEAQAALADLQAGGDLADTVLRCYAEMSRILSEQRGLERPRDMTAREFERDLAAAGLRDEHIRQLTRLFERVRYGARRADVHEEYEAAACLTAIVQAYGRSP